VFRLPEAVVLEGAYDKSITAAQADLVANHAARSVCVTLAPWVRWVTAEGGGRIALELSRIGASSSAMAAAATGSAMSRPGMIRAAGVAGRASIAHL
jgi:hypothetical protein